MKHFFIFFSALVSAAATLQGAVNIVVDFETPDFATAPVVGTNYASNGFTFSVDLGSIGIMESDAIGYNGTQALTPVFDSTAILTVANASDIFDSNRIKIDGLGGSSPIVSVVGTYANNGETIAQIFSLDSLQGFEEFVFDSSTISGSGSNVGFSGLSSLTFTSLNETAFQIDDFAATVVPEPSSALLVGLGAFAYALRRKR
jgi:hypothetical protein